MKAILPEVTLQRLSKLPTKVKQPLEGLFDIGHVDEHILNTVIDAGELSNDVNRLLAFTTSYLFLRQKNVPVADVIHMAKIHGRKINLQWSAKRWELEHDKLSRLETLKALSAQNIRYDVMKFSQRLPERFPGYLIQGSRRLGMEGLRQRHCVASWHPKITSGFCAIAVVFVDRIRWTVELFISEQKKSLWAGQIKTKRNGLADKVTRGRILNALGIDESSQAILAGGGPSNPYVYKANLARLIPVLRELEVESIHINFSGSGDSGQIDDVTIEPESAESVRVSYLSVTREFEDGHYVSRQQEVEAPLNEVITDIVYEYLDDTGVDWYNNDGGYGEFNLDVESNELTMTVNQNFMESTTEFDVEYDLEEFIVMFGA